MGTCDVGSERCWTPQDLADYLGPPITVATVYEWNYRGVGPTYIKVGRHVRYRPEEIEAWLRKREVGERVPDRAGSEKRRGGPAVRPETRPAATTTERRRPSGSESEPSS